MSVWDYELEGIFGSFKMALFRASPCDMAFFGERAEASALGVLQYVPPWKLDLPALSFAENSNVFPVKTQQRKHGKNLQSGQVNPHIVTKWRKKGGRTIFMVVTGVKY